MNQPNPPVIPFVSVLEREKRARMVADAHYLADLFTRVELLGKRVGQTGLSADMALALTDMITSAQRVAKARTGGRKMQRDG